MVQSQINLVVLRVAEIERALNFYRCIGLEFKKHAHGAGPEHYACQNENLVFELYPASSENPVCASTRIGFRVEDVDAIVARLRELQVARVISEPKDSEWGRRAVIADPDGHRIELTKSAG